MTQMTTAAAPLMWMGNPDTVAPMEARTSDLGVEVVLQVRNPCNYRCHYCVATGHNADPVVRFDLARIEQIYQGINGAYTVTAFECGGGEPTAHPQFREVLELAMRYGVASLPTNNSIPPKHWTPAGDLSRLVLRAALHPQGEESLDRFTVHLEELRDRGAVVAALFIAHPARLTKVEEYRAHFGEHGLDFVPYAFIGTWEGRKFPADYTDAEKAQLGLDAPTRHWPHRIEPDTTRIRDFSTIPCLAGFRSLYIKADGTLQRCLYDPQPLRKPLRRAAPCTVTECGCGLLLEELNTLDHSFENWRRYTGLPALAPVDEGCPEELVRRKRETYYALMDQHGKLQQYGVTPPAAQLVTPA